MKAEALNAVIGGRLRSARTDRGWTVEHLASKAEIGKGSLSEIENGSRSPNLSTLHALAGALGVPLSWLLADRVGAEVRAPGLTGRLLGTTTHADATVEVYALDLDPGAPYVADPHEGHVAEHVIVTSGTVRVGRKGAEATLAVGESTSWISDAHHRFEALHNAPATAILVIRWPTHQQGSEPR